MTHQIAAAWLAAAASLRQQAVDPSLDVNICQACLRRSISTAYYAVFHLITAECVALVCIDADESPVAQRLRRSLNHSDLKKVLSSLIGSVEYGRKQSGLSPIAIPLQCIQALAETFIGLQNAREAAVYAFDQALANAEAVISEWQQLSLDLKLYFAQLLLLRVMPNQR